MKNSVDALIEILVFENDTDKEAAIRHTNACRHLQVIACDACGYVFPGPFIGSVYGRWCVPNCLNCGSVMVLVKEDLEA